MTETIADLVACEDVLTFVNAAITGTGQREFHHDAAEQTLSLGFLHAYMRENYRELYAATLALDVNDHNAALIVRGLLSTARDADDAQRRLEGRLVARRLELLPPQRVYRLFRALRRDGVNNRRTRAIMRDWLLARPDLAFDAVKYRGALKDAVRHAHLNVEDLVADAPDHVRQEIGRIFYGATGHPFVTPIFETWRQAHYAQAAVYKLPFTVAEGFAAQHGIPRKRFLERAERNMTRLERLRLQGHAGENKARLDIDLATVPLTRLATYVLSLPLDERSARRAELTGALRAAARRAAGPDAGRWGRVAAVLDDSFSTIGSAEKRRRPLAVALGGHFLLEALAGEFHPFWTSGRTDPLLLYPFGPTPLGTRLLDALDTAPDRLVIVSDGFDNAPPGLAAEVLRVWRSRLDPDRRVSITHLNPVYDAEGFDVRRLVPTVPTAGVRDAEDLLTLVELARFAEGRVGLPELRAHLDARMARFLTPTGATEPPTPEPEDPASEDPALDAEDSTADPDDPSGDIQDPTPGTERTEAP
ncbi:hypothetical protein [Actinomadura rupiterrae]|uniref:hypothetical protein n=1 Tax=Actinomadura rupiterrae TaxID=559627 RepID=UPI0020A2FD83|nr:hypothetical protein [Actinomadura rupiterrae]MCP2340949.1 hypothetical protein [Actinomadura rupiterrae]